MRAFDTLKQDYRNQWVGGGSPGRAGTSLGRGGMGRTPEERRANAPQESEQMAQEAEDLRLENVDIMKAELAKREEAKNRPSGMPDPDWKPGIPADMLSKEDNPWQTFYDNEYKRGVLGSMAKGGMGSPGGAAIMGQGVETIGTAASAEQANNTRQAAAFQALQAQGNEPPPQAAPAPAAPPAAPAKPSKPNLNPPGAGSAGAGARSGTVTYTPGGNVARGPAMDDFDIERLRQARLATQALEESIPSVAAERERIQANFDLGTGHSERLAKYAGDIDRAEAFRTRKQKATEAYDPDIYRTETEKPLYDAERQGNEVLRRLKAKTDADLAEWRLRKQADVEIQGMKSGSTDLKTHMDAFNKANALPGWSDEDKASKIAAIAEVIATARENGINILARPEVQEAIAKLQGQAQPRAVNTPATNTLK